MLLWVRIRSALGVMLEGAPHWRVTTISCVQGYVGPGLGKHLSVWRQSYIL